MATVAGLQGIAPVPTATEFIDAVLNATMRKTPTVIHKNVSAKHGTRRMDRSGKLTLAVQDLTYPQLYVVFSGVARGDIRLAARQGARRTIRSGWDAV